MSIPKILVIDDQLALRKAMHKALKNDNYHIVYAENGRQGLGQLQKEEPDLIFLDLRMPVMDGFGFLEHIRIKPQDPYLVVAITGHGDDKEVKQCFELGVNFFLRKPLSMTEVRCLTNRCLEMKANEKELRLHRDSLESLVAERTHELANTNTALRVLLKQVKESKEEMEGKVLENLKNLVFPYLETLQENLANTPQAEYIEVIQNNIKKITSSFTINLTSNFLGLSPREIQVADLVRQGRTNKESANIMNISKNAVEFHRNNLRKKLGIQNQKINLRTYLYSMH